MTFPYSPLMNSQILGLQITGGGVGLGIGLEGWHPGGTIQSCAMFAHDWSICPSGRLQSFARLLSQTPKKQTFDLKLDTDLKLDVERKQWCTAK